MKTIFFAQLGLTAVLALSISACQKNNGSSDPAPAAVPAPASQEKPMTSEPSREEALAHLETIGLRFVTLDTDPSTTAAWDLGFFRAYLKSDALKPDLQVQIEVLKSFVHISENLVASEMDSDLNGGTESGESSESELAMSERALILSQIDLAQARIERLEKRLARQQSEQETE